MENLEDEQGAFVTDVEVNVDQRPKSGLAFD